MQAPLKARPQMPLWLVRMSLIGRTMRPPVRGLPPKRRSWLVPKSSGSRSQIRAPPRRHRDGVARLCSRAHGGPSVGRPSPGGGGVRNTRRRDQSRGGGGAGAKNRGLGEVTPFDWRQQDYADREQRLQKSEGFLNRVRRDVRKKDVPTGEKAKTLKQTGGSATIQSPVVLKELSAITGVKVNDIVRRLVKKGQPLMTGDGSSPTIWPWS